MNVNPRLQEPKTSAILSPVKHSKQGLVHIGFVGDLEQKAERDHYSGLLRFLAARDVPWEIRTVNPNAATDAQLLQFRDWSPVGLIAEPEFLRILTRRLAVSRLRRHVTVYMNREHIPHRSKGAVDISLDNSNLAEAAASLLMKRGLVNFAYIDELERPEETARSRIRGDAFVRFLERNNFGCARYSHAFGGGRNYYGLL